MAVERVLITGGTGKTGRHVAARLTAMGIDVAIGTRTPDGPRHRRFHWADPSSASAFDGCDAAYLVAPTDRADHLAVMQPLLQEAMGRGVRRFVLLSSSLLEAGGPMMGEVHAWLARNASAWAVLRPSWFMQNFSEGPHAATIREEGIIYTATGTGRVGFIDAEDIAATAAASLTAATPLNSDIVLTGPEALSYDDTAAIITAALGRPVRHVSLDPAALATRLVAQGLRADYAEMLTGLDADIASGAEDRTTLGVEQVTRQRPASFRAFADRVRETWK
ncbi:ergot alkaloid biosynthesis protein [Falsiroseomonas bella]|uniref:Ergot alkaloid biosynthesis protein n=1 Tax=Falsiroseomonas bella TaxID=2184016 RepID=A0A317F6W1_9PROT|nr:NAD(P)H-binding protein [Falsiroseomonas bella]PWS34272.1 ergot alkaloid biosynthesis protein [Falsiroseomonas bella]